ncbi:MAG: endo-1,4-beta-xylanase, partial [Draconibacterium sp.]|nr:endo-1,4-beta-xylanase [Draconibacterium sp.]
HVPTVLELYKNDPPRLKSECIEHIEEAVTLTKGKLIDWDVINEPYTNHDIQDVCGDEVMADWFKKAKEIDPVVKRYINDYSILGNGGTDKNHQDHYFKTIKYIDDNGGEIDGIGMQCHFAELVTGIPKVIEILDRFSGYNKEIKITEFDINTTNDSLKVNYTRDFFTVLFSYPYVKSILSWGFWEGRHWRPDAAMYNLDWSIRPQGEMYKNLVFDEWWTKEQLQVSDSNGDATFESCFLGTYEITVQKSGNTFKIEVPVHFNNESNFTINVDNQSFSLIGEEHEETPVFTSAKNIKSTGDIEIKVYPNPASEYIKIESSRVLEDCHVEIIDVSGRCVLNKNINLSISNKINLEKLKTGLYYLSIQLENQKITKRFIVR